MPWSRRTHWRIVHSLARLAGCGFVIVGIIVSFWGVRLLLDSEASLMVDGRATRDPAIKAIVLISGIVAAVLGSLLLRARPFRDESKA